MKIQGIKKADSTFEPALLGCGVGLEPTTFRTTIRRSNQLNYTHHVFRLAKLV